MTLLVIIIILALIFDYINGFHDAANSIATVVSTKVLTPFQAVLWAALFNFVAFFIFKDHGVANTIAKTVKPDFVTLPVIFSGLIAAIFWNLLTWWYGIPSSSSHTLIGGFAGAAIAHAGFNAIDSAPVIKTASFILLAPLVGMIMAYIISLWFLNSFRKGIAPKIISLVIVCLFGWLVAVNLTGHPDASKIKGEEKKAKFDGVERKTVSVSVYDVQEADVVNKWREVLQANQGKVTGDNEMVAEGVVIKEFSDKPVTVYSKIAKEKDFKIKLHLGIVADSVWLNKKSDSARFVAAADYLVKFATKTTKEAPVRYGYAFISGSNFKWFLIFTIIFIIGIFTMFLSNLNHYQSTAWFKRFQLLSSAIFSVGHGGNDAQKVMGIISAALISYGTIGDIKDMPNWVPLTCYAAIALGTMSGGWKIIKTMGTRITKVTPFEGVAAETAGAVTLFLTENLKIPVSTTHTITGAIIGVGATKRLSAVRWGVTINLLWAWILTIPVSGAIGALVYYITSAF
ncbi:MAG: inorganic phosphate transporter [Bacteroidia bacterium]